MQDLQKNINTNDIIFTKEDFEFFKDITIAAGQMAAEIQDKHIEVKRKEDTSIVTQADLKVQNFLVSSIKKRFNNINFIYEEDFDISKLEMDDEKISIIIDPIDGTAMFSMHLPIWCVSIGVFKGYTPLYGFVYSPGAKMFFYNDDSCAYLNGEIVVVNNDMKIDSETNLFYSTEVKNFKTLSFPGKVRNLGSTALHACLTVDNVRNRVVGYIGKAFLWDWAGAIPIIRKAGGKVVYLSGEEIDFKDVAENKYRFTDYVVAYNCSDFRTMRDFFIME